MLGRAIGVAAALLSLASPAHACDPKAAGPCPPPTLEQRMREAESWAARSCREALDGFDRLLPMDREAVLAFAGRSEAIAACLDRGELHGAFDSLLYERREAAARPVVYRDPAGRFELVHPSNWVVRSPACPHTVDPEHCTDAHGDQPLAGSVTLLSLWDPRPRDGGEADWYRNVHVMLVDPAVYRRRMSWSDDPFGQNVAPQVSRLASGRTLVVSSGVGFEGGRHFCEDYEIRSGRRLYVARTCHIAVGGQAGDGPTPAVAREIIASLRISALK